MEATKQRRDISILIMKVAYSEKTQRKVNEKGGIDSLEKMHTKKRRKHKDGKTYVKQCKRRKRKSKEEISLEEDFFYFTKHFSKKKRDKSDKSRNKKGFLKTLKKGGKENENKKKR